MPHFSTDPDRRSVRLSSERYLQGWYFITLCTRERVVQFGTVQNDCMHLNTFGEIVQASWQSLSQRFPSVHLDASVIMPNHMHGILVLNETSPNPSKYHNLSSVPQRFRAFMQENSPFAILTLGEIVRTLKALATHQIRNSGNPSFAWQPRYYEHVIRNMKDLKRIQTYILNNPARWKKDSLYQ